MFNKESYLEKPIEFNGVLTKQRILLSDSKARYIKKHESLIEDLGYFIEFQSRGGARLLDYFFWLKRNLQAKVQQYGHLIIYQGYRNFEIQISQLDR